MPKYEYRCPCCGIVVLVQHGIKETHAIRCEKCALTPKMVKIPSLNNLLNVG